MNIGKKKNNCITRRVETNMKMLKFVDRSPFVVANGFLPFYGQ